MANETAGRLQQTRPMAVEKTMKDKAYSMRALWAMATAGKSQSAAYARSQGAACRFNGVTLSKRWESPICAEARENIPPIVPLGNARCRNDTLFANRPTRGGTRDRLSALRSHRWPS